MRTKHRHAPTRTHTHAHACTRESLTENHSPLILRLRTQEPHSEFSWCGEICAGKPVRGQDSTGNFMMMASHSSVPWTPGSALDGGELTAPRQGPAGLVLVPQVRREDTPTGLASASGAVTLHSGPMGPTLHKASSPVGEPRTTDLVARRGELPPSLPAAARAVLAWDAFPEAPRRPSAWVPLSSGKLSLLPSATRGGSSQPAVHRPSFLGGLRVAEPAGTF